MRSEILFGLIASVMTQHSFGQNFSEICDSIDNGQFVADPNDCSHFYQCIDGAGTSGSCPPGMLFDPSEQFCNFEVNVICKSDTEFTETTILSSTTSLEVSTVTTIPSSPIFNAESTTVSSSGQAEKYCRSSDPNIPSFAPSSTSCEQYYICVNQKPFQLSCAKGRHWNQRKQYCDNPKEVNCQVRLVSDNWLLS
ncbi:probable chitinase 10 [Topomyia yanbarensis]|uniref:probable chitinase 10 n=1 Tax=Topomyia yanbarensis TaxID=2498891 RepID=UPI00273B69A7|nr:probable chitinase 10 [Topomyia yanbarensis]